MYQSLGFFLFSLSDSIDLRLSWAEPAPLQISGLFPVLLLFLQACRRDPQLTRSLSEVSFVAYAICVLRT